MKIGFIVVEWVGERLAFLVGEEKIIGKKKNNLTPFVYHSRFEPITLFFRKLLSM
jgi:hypothetical protein